MLEQAAAFYQQQLDRYPEALRYLSKRGLQDPALIKALEIGYAPGGSLRRHLTAQGYSFDLLQQLGLLNVNGSDALFQRIVFPLRQDEHIVNLYGRSIGAALAHRFLPGTKGGLYAWEKVRHCPEVILVEGLCDGERTVYLTFDVDANQSGQLAAEQLACRLRARGIVARRVLLPQGHDPNSFFVEGADARQFQSLVEASLP